MLEHRKQSIAGSLKDSHLFRSLTDSQLNRVCKNCITKKLGEGQLLFSQGDSVDCFYLVLTGKIKLFRESPDGKEKIIEIIPAGEIFAEALMFLDEPHYPVTSTALTDTVVIGINANKFKEMLSESVDTCMLLLGNMSYRLRKLVYEIDVLTLHTSTCRVAAFLLENLPSNEDQFSLGFAKNVIAARLSIKPETLSRIIKNFRKQHILSIDGRRVTIHDRSALVELSLI